jgi:hypothetical protein
MDFPITREQFRQWLEGKDAENVVGYTCNNNACPIATALLEVTRTAYNVGSLFYYIEDGTFHKPEDFKPVPIWAADFISHVDADGSEDVSVKASTALAILEEIPL